MNAGLASDLSQLRISKEEAADVRFGSKADIEALPLDVRFTPKSRH
jgi:hypothetical protein